MRTITHGDVVAAARAIAAVPAGRRAENLRRLLDKADAADRFRKRHGRAHPLWGNGTLMAAALPMVPAAAEPFAGERAYLECLGQVIEALLSWKDRAR
ncbi:MAG: hypothetical protein CVT84_01800 [Alphaproteobacteria bacterium HGW-Alphaproteobacteria-6]|nr:MAG: hypothetical protein CVT84_01800 [Alphaproteobacteria bacterium HGW-Alphaproteobacteria-6]